MKSPKLLTSTKLRSRQSTGQCDCACAFPSSVDFSSVELTGSWHAISNIQAFSLPNDWQGFFVPTGPTSLAVLNQPAYELWGHFRYPQVIENNHFDPGETQVLQQMASAGLLLCKESPDVQFAACTLQLSAWLHLTDRCNLRCSYCYLPHVPEDISLETGQRAVEAVFRSAARYGYQQVKLKYSGGEPLLRFPLVIELQRYAQGLAAKNDFELDGVVLSNGTLLTKKILSDLQAHNLRLMISLDGVGHWHDVQRPYANGQASFRDVTAAVKLAVDHGLVPHMSITISGRNAAGLPEVVSWTLERDLPFSINFYRRNDFSAEYKDLKLEEEKIIRGMMSAFKVIEANLPQYSLLTSLADRANLAVPHTCTCSVGQDYMVFNQSGGVAKCQMKMDRQVADIHVVDPLALVRADLDGVQNISVEEKEDCRDCQWKYWCAGGCPLETYRVTGRYDLKSPNCNIYKAIFPEILRLEGLRLLQSAGELKA